MAWTCQSTCEPRGAGKDADLKGLGRGKEFLETGLEVSRQKMELRRRVGAENGGKEGFRSEAEELLDALLINISQR